MPPDLIGLQLPLQPTNNCALPSNYTYWLHAWFLEQIRGIDPKLSAYLHDNQTEKAFSLSSFLGGAATLGEGRTLAFEANTAYHCQITALCAPVSKALKRWLTHPPREISLKGGHFAIAKPQISLPAITYEQLWDEAPAIGELSLTFLTPTGFHKHGNHMPLPIPENLFHSYLRRWNSFAHLEFDQDDFLAWVNECVVLLRHDIRSRKAQPGKQGSVTGFVGSIQLGLTPKAQQEPEYVQLVQSLVCAAPYFCTGHKTTFGLGQTRIGWSAPPTIAPPRSVAPPSSPAPQPAKSQPIKSQPPKSQPPKSQPITSQPAIADAAQLRKQLIQARIAELEPQFIATRKRQGGDRAKDIARQWATILARYEAGDSLKAIAADLNIPYDTAKKYAQLARKQLS